MTIVFGLVPSKSQFPQSLSLPPKIFIWVLFFFFFLKRIYQHCLWSNYCTFKCTMRFQNQLINASLQVGWIKTWWLHTALTALQSKVLQVSLEELLSHQQQTKENGGNFSSMPCWWIRVVLNKMGGVRQVRLQCGAEALLVQDRHWERVPKGHWCWLGTHRCPFITCCSSAAQPFSFL